MARMPYYVHELPFQPRKNLCCILDADRRWEELGGVHMHLDTTNLILIGQAVQRDKSPTGELLNRLGDQNKTIKRLFLMLVSMDHQRAMSVLLPYVDKKYHCCVRTESMTTSSFLQKYPDRNHPMHMFSNSLSWDSESNALLVAQSSMLSHETTPSNTHRSNMLNINESPNNLSIHSKTTQSNAQGYSESQNSASKKPTVVVDLKKRNAMNCGEESLSDNCASTKLKNIPSDSICKQKFTSNEYAKAAVKYSNDSELKSLDKCLPDIMKIPYTEILVATKDFTNSRVLGRGGFGTVYKGKWKGTLVAIKRLMPRHGTDSVSKHLISLKQSFNELNILKCCRFDHILPLYGVALDGPEPCLVYQLMSNGSLEDRLLCRNNTPPLTWSQRSSIAECTSKGLNYLHTTSEKSLVHGDIKSANILLDSNMEAKIGDFGLTKVGPGCDNTHVKVSKLHGTECYLPPEYLRHRQLSPQVDVYSYGIVLLEMATSLRPYDASRGDDAKLLVDYVSDCHSSGRLDSLRDAKAGEENMMWFGELIKIGQKCSCKEKKKRPTMLQVLECFEKIKDELMMVDKIRRLSNDRSSLGDPSKLKQLSPEELQVFYDMYKEKYGIIRSSTPGCSLATNQNSISVSPSEDVQVLNEASHISEARPSCSHDSGNKSCGCSVTTADVAPMVPFVPIINTSSTEEAASSSDDRSSNGQAPIPLLTVLQLQVSDISAMCSSSRREESVSDFSQEYSSESNSSDSVDHLDCGCKERSV